MPRRPSASRDGPSVPGGSSAGTAASEAALRGGSVTATDGDAD